MVTEKGDWVRIYEQQIAEYEEEIFQLHVKIGDLKREIESTKNAIRDEMRDEDA